MKIIASRSLYFLFLLSILIILSSCAKTRTLDPLTQSEQSKIKKIAILVEADEEFSVSVEKEKRYLSEDVVSEIIELEPFSGVLLIVGGLIEYGIKSHVDEKHEEILEPKLIQFQPNEIMSDRLRDYLELTNAGFTAEISEV